MRNEVLMGKIQMNGNAKPSAAAAIYDKGCTIC
jgi:hypothetical protein